MIERGQEEAYEEMGQRVRTMGLGAGISQDAGDVPQGSFERGGTTLQQRRVGTDSYAITKRLGERAGKGSAKRMANGQGEGVLGGKKCGKILPLR